MNPQGLQVLELSDLDFIRAMLSIQKETKDKLEKYHREMRTVKEKLNWN